MVCSNSILPFALELTDISFNNISPSTLSLNKKLILNQIRGKRKVAYVYNSCS